MRAPTDPRPTRARPAPDPRPTRARSSPPVAMPAKGRGRSVRTARHGPAERLRHDTPPDQERPPGRPGLGNLPAREAERCGSGISSESGIGKVTAAIGPSRSCTRAADSPGRWRSGGTPDAIAPGPGRCAAGASTPGARSTSVPPCLTPATAPAVPAWTRSGVADLPTAGALRRSGKTRLGWHGAATAHALPHLFADTRRAGRSRRRR